MADDRQRILELFEALRVTDVCDGMDAVGLQDVGLLDKAIRPLWRDSENFTHRIYGLAHTVRFRPASERAPVFESVEQHMKWKGDWYRNRAAGPIVEDIREGDLIVIDAQGIPECGFIGSNNSLSWLAAGARGAVTNGGARDTDELIKQRVPVYSRGISRGIRPGRLELESTGRPVTVGGVFIRPGDVIVADGDGAIAVPLEQAERVARIAREIQVGDQESRRQLYEKLGMEPDFTLQSRQ